MISKIEDSIEANFPEELHGISSTIILKVSSSSIIEAAFEKTKHFSQGQWNAILDEDIYATENFSDIGTLTPKLYLKNDVVQGLKEYSFKFMSSENIRPLKLSHVIKYVVYAYYKEFIEV